MLREVVALEQIAVAAVLDRGGSVRLRRLRRTAEPSAEGSGDR